MSIVYALLGIVVFLFLFSATMSSIIYWYETVNTPCEQIPSPKPGITACAQVYMLSLMGYVTAIALYPIGLFWHRKPSPLTPDAKPDKTPVILVHGLNDNASVLLFLYHRLQKQGYPVLTFSYYSLFVPLETIETRFDDFAHMVEVSFPGHKPVFIGHSLGGLLIRRWLMKPENEARPLGVITLATPHAGSKMAMFAPGALAKKLMPGSDMIATLKEAAPSGSVPCVSLVSPIDEAVLPAASLVPPEGWKMRITNRASHHSMLFCSRVFKTLLEELRAIEDSARTIPEEAPTKQ